MGRIAIYGGSFNPPHLGHLEVVRKGVELLPIDKLIVVPAYKNPLKKGEIAPPDIRLKWCRQLFSPIPKVEVSDWELKQGRPVYSYETISHFRQLEGDARPFFIIGSDNLFTLERWKRWRELLKMVELVVATRGELPADLVEKYGVKWILPVEVPISSTEIRGGKWEGVPTQILEEVKGVYGTDSKTGGTD